MIKKPDTFTEQYRREVNVYLVNKPRAEALLWDTGTH
jgi:hypothetical protein